MPEAHVDPDGTHYIDTERSSVIIRDTRGASDLKYVATMVDNPGLGAGDSVREAVLSLANSYRRVADMIEKTQK
jgi:hypothetical protein